MKKAFLLLCIAVLFGCSSSPQDPAKQATELIKSKGISLPPFTSMDSVFGYKEAFACEMKGIQVQWRADSLLKDCKEKGTVNVNKKDLISYGEIAYTLKKEAAKIELRERLKQTPKEFVGYETLLGDSITGSIIRVVMDKDMNEIAIDRRK